MSVRNAAAPGRYFLPVDLLPAALKAWSAASLAFCRPRRKPILDRSHNPMNRTSRLIGRLGLFSFADGKPIPEG
jgi:hypothetical protein